jgi:hypothetical protein
MEPFELTLSDFSRLALSWVRPGLLRVFRWTRGNEFTQSSWVLTGATMLTDEGLQRLVDLIQSGHNSGEPATSLSKLSLISKHIALGV